MTNPLETAGISPTGVVGKVRSPAAVVIFTIITLGIYYIYWVYQVGREMKEYNDSGLGPLVNLLLALSGMFIGFTLIVLWFTLPNDVAGTYERDNRRPTISALAGFWHLLPIIGSIIWLVKIQNRLNALWEGRA